MSQIKWVTPAGDLGVIAEQEFFQFALNAIDTAFGTIAYSLIAGSLPRGLRVNYTTNNIEGVPISEAGTENSKTSTFTIRAKNTDSGSVADRTFSLSVTSLVPPSITLPSQDLGLYLVGTTLNLQLAANGISNKEVISWRVKSGELPLGISLSPSGLLQGYFNLIPSTSLNGTIGWDVIPYNTLGWDYPQGTVSKTFTFEIEVFDGLYYDTETYNITVFPRSQLRADSTSLTADAATIDMSLALTVDTGVKHNPVILTTNADLPNARENTFLAFDINAIDLDGDALSYQIFTPPVELTGYFAEQSLIGDSITYVAQVPQGNLISSGVYPRVTTTIQASNVNSLSSSDDSLQELVNGDIIKVLQSDGLWHNATVTSEVTARISGKTIVTATAGDYLTQSLTNTNVTVISSSVTTGNIAFAGNISLTANIGDYITQASTGANVQVTKEILYGQSKADIEFISGAMNTGSGNIAINGTAVDAYPIDINANTDIRGTYNDANIFTVKSVATAANAVINSTDTLSSVTEIIAVGVTVGGLATEGKFGFDETKFSQELLIAPGGAVVARTTYVAASSSGTTLKVVSTTGVAPGVLASGEGIGSILVLSVDDATTITLADTPPGPLNDGQDVVFVQESTVSIDLDTGWLTGQLPAQTVNKISYNFEVMVFKALDPTYFARALYTLTVLGDLSNTIDFVTNASVGRIENGQVSDMAIEAVSSLGANVIYNLSIAGSHRLPQGLQLTANGLITGRVSFSLYGLDHNTTTIDNGTTSFDYTYKFSVTASDLSGEVSNTKEFTITVVNRNIVPYENLYLSALPTVHQRDQFNQVMKNTQIFRPDLIYRSSDPYFGIATDIRTLFLPGLSASTIAEYINAASTNHFKKRVAFGDIKTAVAIDENFDIKYEVVYIEILDENTNKAGKGPVDSFELPSTSLPYLGQYTTAYPNAFSNMQSAMSTLGYANKGALPDWMTSRQMNGKVLGFTRAMVLAYTIPGASETIAFRLGSSEFNWNTIDFTVDRYHLDNNLSSNYDVANTSFFASSETTFDRYPALGGTFVNVGTVDYAVSTPFQEINSHSAATVIASGGLDGITSFKDGDHLVFAQQEFLRSQNDIADYNQGWALTTVIWDNQVDLGWDAALWDAAAPVPGYNEHLLDSNVANERIGVWKVNIGTDSIITLEFVQSIEFFNTLYVRNGFTYGRTNIYFDPYIKAGDTIPTYSLITQEISITGTTFDGNGTRFSNHRDNYAVPGKNDKYLNFSKTNIFI